MFMLRDNTYDLNLIKDLFIGLVNVGNITEWSICYVKLAEAGFAIYVEVILHKIEEE